MLRLIAFLVLLATAVVSPAQDLPQYLFSHVGGHNGLVSDEVTGIQQDQQGFIWIATKNGLQRYDGQRLLSFHYSTGDPRSIPDNEILSMAIDKKNRLWLLCGENRAGYLDVSDFTFHETGLPVPDFTKKLKDISRLAIDHAGNVIVVFAKQETLTYDEAIHAFSKDINPFLIPEGWRINSVYQDARNNYWLACDSGLVKFNPADKSISYRAHNPSRDPVINALGNIENVSLPFLDSRNRFWVHAWAFNGEGPFLFSYNPDDDKVVSWATDLWKQIGYKYFELFNIQEDSRGIVWVSGTNLMAGFNKATGKFDVTIPDLPGEYSIRFDEVRGIFEDNENNLWVSTNKGIFRFNPSAQLFHTVQNKRYLKDRIYYLDVTGILQLREGEILIATWGNGIFPYDNEFKPVQRPYIDQALRAGENGSWCVYQAKNGDIWRGHQDGYVYITYARSKKSEKLVSPAFAGSTVRQITEDGSGNLWFGTQRGQLVQRNASTGLFQQVMQLKGRIQRLYTDHAGDVWVCTSTDGVYWLNNRDATLRQHFTKSAGSAIRLSGSGAADIIQYNDSLYLIASNGLNILDIKNNTIRYFTAENGLPSNSITNVQRDRHGYIWMTTQNGICSYNMEKGLLSIYDAENGVHTNTFNLGASTVLQDGRIVFGTAHDAIVFNPDDFIKKDLTPPDVQITGFSLANKWLPMDSLRKLNTVDLKFDQTSIMLEFSTLTYNTKYGITYMMEGLDQHWIAAGTISQVVYNHLPPGHYTFKIKAENGKNIFSRRITEFRIYVAAPFWKTWWFYSILALLAVILLYWIDRERVKRLRTVEQMRISIAGNLHEEVNTALNNINVLSEIARIKADQQLEQSKDYIEEIHRQSHDMIISMDDMLWSIDPANDSMSKSIDRMREFAAALQNRHDTEIVLQADDAVFPIKLDMRKRHEWILVYKLALRLLVEQVHAQKVHVQLDYVKSSLQVTILSEATRLPENAVSVKKLITEIRNRLNTVGGYFDIENDEKGVVMTAGIKL